MLKWIKDTKEIKLSGMNKTVGLQSNALAVQFGRFSCTVIMPTFVSTSFRGKDVRILIVDMNRVIQIVSALFSLLIITSIKRK